MKIKWKTLLVIPAICIGLLTPDIKALAVENVLPVACAPAGVAEMKDGSLLVTDIYHKVVWKIRDGKGEIYAGSSGVEGLYGQPVGGYRDGVLAQALFGKPWAIVPFKEGYAVSDPDNNAVRLLSGNRVKTINLGSALSNPTGLAVDGNGALYISDTNHNRIVKVTASGVVSTWLGGLSEPTGLCFKNGTLYIADSGNNRILEAKDGKITAVMGTPQGGYKDGDLRQAKFANPMGVAVDEDGTVFVADTGNSAIRKIKGNTVTTLMKNQGKGLENVPVSPTGLLLKRDSIYICDTFSRYMIVIPKEQ